LRATEFNNMLLKSLAPDAISRLRLHPIQFELKHELEHPGKPIKHLYFIEDGTASMTTTFKDGSQVEVGMFGYEAVIGVAALMGTRHSVNRLYTQIAGSGYYCSVDAAKAEFALCGRFQSLVLRYVQTQLLQAAQTAGCNAKHNFVQRLARWLLVCADRARSDTFHMSHSLLADMLGGTRSTVTIAAGALKKKGLIKYSRGVIRILDGPQLEKAACECYRVIKENLDAYPVLEHRATLKRAE
jgi:CRP-like cAMP-binding protein